MENSMLCAVVIVAVCWLVPIALRLVLSSLRSAGICIPQQLHRSLAGSSRQAGTWWMGMYHGFHPGRLAVWVVLLLIAALLAYADWELMRATWGAKVFGLDKSVATATATAFVAVHVVTGFLLMELAQEESHLDTLGLEEGMRRLLRRAVLAGFLVAVLLAGAGAAMRAFLGAMGTQAPPVVVVLTAVMWFCLSTLVAGLGAVAGGIVPHVIDDLVGLVVGVAVLLLVVAAWCVGTVETLLDRAFRVPGAGITLMESLRNCLTDGMKSFVRNLSCLRGKPGNPGASDSDPYDGEPKLLPGRWEQPTRTRKEDTNGNETDEGKDDAEGSAGNSEAGTAQA